MRSIPFALLVLASASATDAAPLTCLEAMNRLQAIADPASLEALQATPHIQDAGEVGKRFDWRLPEGINVGFNCTPAKAIWAVSVSRQPSTPWASFRSMSAKGLCTLATGWTAATCEQAFDRAAERAKRIGAHHVWADLGNNRSIDFANWTDIGEEFSVDTTNKKELPSSPTPVALTWVDNWGKPIP